jgi:hypothetical protein
MGVRVNIGTTGPNEPLRVWACVCEAVPRIGEDLEMNGAGGMDRYTVTHVRHWPQPIDPTSKLNGGEDEPSIYVEAVAWDIE